MLKRGLGLSFILVAIITLLVHGAIPHHHHEKQVCLQSSHCKNDHDISKQLIGSPAHHHDGENDLEPCVLKHYLLVRLTLTKQELRPFASFKILNYSGDCQAMILNGFHLIPSLSLGSNSLHQGYLPLPYTQIVNPGNGLRAPPVA